MTTPTFATRSGIFSSCAVTKSRARPTGARRSIGCALVALVVATAIWLPCVRFCFAPRLDAAPLLRRQVAQLDDAALARAAMAPARAANPEWALMGQTFVAWALANDALRTPAHATANLAHIDQLLARIVADERE